jgi:uncharacterized damage-inducible protein DinB
MALVDTLLPEFDREMTVTRKMLERVPLGHGEWKPHPKSRTIRQLATHIANIPILASHVLTTPELDMGVGYVRQGDATTTEELLGRFDENVRKTRGDLVGKTDGELLTTWTLKRDGKEMFSVPKAGALRTFFLSHLIHHRGQLSVYLRLNDVTVPSVYGPSADETPWS